MQSILLILLILGYINSDSIRSKECTLNDDIKFRSVDLTSFDYSDLYFNNSNLFISLCEPFKVELIEKYCWVDDAIKNSNVIMFHVLEPKFNTCVFYSHEDLALTNFEYSSETVSLIVSKDRVEYSSGLVQLHTFNIQFFFRGDRNESFLEHRYSLGEKYHTINLFIPEKAKGHLKYMYHAVSSWELRVGVISIFKVIVFILQFYMLFCFHLETKIEYMKYPIQKVAFMYQIYYLSLMILGLYPIHSLMLNSIVSFVMIVVAYSAFGYLSEERQQTIPVFLDLIVIAEAFGQVSEQLQNLTQFGLLVGVPFITLAIIGKLFTFMRWINKKKHGYNREIMITITQLFRMMMYLIYGLKPIPNPSMAYLVYGWEPTWTMEQRINLLIFFAILLYTFFNLRMISTMLQYRFELIGVFEKYYKIEFGAILREERLSRLRSLSMQDEAQNSSRRGTNESDLFLDVSMDNDTSLL